MGHTCSTVLIKCMDFRLTRDVYAWLEEKQLVNDCDMISVAGATKDLVENPQGFFSPDQTQSTKTKQTNCCRFWNCR